jgi:hypothetical protein
MLELQVCLILTSAVQRRRHFMCPQVRLLTSIERRAFRSVIWVEAPASILMVGSVPLERRSHIWFLLLALFTLVGICGAQSLQQEILTSIYVK